MKNLIRVLHSPELDDDTFHRRTQAGLPNPGDVVKIFNKIVAEVVDSEGRDVALRYCLGNRHPYETFRTANSFTTLFFPEDGQVEYRLKDGNFWKNTGIDPIQVYGTTAQEPGIESDLPSFCSLDFYIGPGCVLADFFLFYSKNPFLKKNFQKYHKKMPIDYKDVNPWFPSIKPRRGEV